MLMFTLAISCLTTFNLPGFMDLTLQVPMQYCSLQHQALLLSPVTSTTGYCFCFGSISSFFLELFLQWSPVTFWVLNDVGSSSFSVLSFYLFILFSTSIRCTKTCNAWRQYWSTERAQFFSTTTAEHMLDNQCFKSWMNWAVKFCPITIFTWPLATDYHFFKHLDNFLQGKRFHNQQEAENGF